MSSLFQRLLGRARQEYVVRLQPARLRVGGKRIGIDYDRFPRSIVIDLARGWYEEHERHAIRRLRQEGRIRRGTRVLDIGCAIGLTAMTIADAVGDATIVAYEADPETAARCRANLALNGHAFAVENAAVTSSSEATATFHVSDAFVASSLHESAAATRTITVPAVNFCRELARLRPEVLVMDVEGAETNLLTSVDDFGPLHTICVELHPRVVGKPAIRHMMAHLESRGFRRQPSNDDAVAVLYRDPS